MNFIFMHFIFAFILVFLYYVLFLILLVHEHIVFEETGLSGLVIVGDSALV